MKTPFNITWPTKGQCGELNILLKIFYRNVVLLCFININFLFNANHLWKWHLPSLCVCPLKGLISEFKKKWSKTCAHNGEFWELTPAECIRNLVYYMHVPTLLGLFCQRWLRGREIRPRRRITRPPGKFQAIKFKLPYVYSFAWAEN